MFNRFSSRQWPLLAQALTAAVFSFSAPASAQTPVAPGAPLLQTADRWAMETVHLKDGSRLHGLVQSIDEESVELIEVVRNPGKPMHLVIRPVPGKQVAQIERLSESQRRELSQRIEKFRNRALIEADAMESVTLAQGQIEDVSGAVYEGKWFHLVSTAGDRMTRRAVVRMEQIFRAYRLVAPMRRSPQRPVRIIFFGAMGEYRDYLRRHNLTLANEAFYSARRNTIVAGCDVERYARQLERIDNEHALLRQSCERLAAQFSQRRREVTLALKEEGLTREQINQEMAALQNACNEQMASLHRRISQARRRNDARLDQLAEATYRRLYHEAFHAWWQSYVAPPAGDTPCWLDEGLAQIFESGQLESDTLRIDAPRRDWLERLQADLLSGQPLPLMKLLSTSSGALLSSHSAAGEAERLYLYAWGVAWHLTIDEPVLDAASLQGALNGDLSEAQQFERLVGGPIEEYERRWRHRMLQLKPFPQ